MRGWWYWRASLRFTSRPSAIGLLRRRAATRGDELRFLSRSMLVQPLDSMAQPHTVRQSRGTKHGGRGGRPLYARWAGPPLPCMSRIAAPPASSSRAAPWHRIQHEAPQPLPPDNRPSLASSDVLKTMLRHRVQNEIPAKGTSLPRKLLPANEAESYPRSIVVSSTSTNLPANHGTSK